MAAQNQPPRLSRPRLSVWILAGTLISALLPLLICLALIGNYSEQRARQHVLDEMRQQGDDVADELLQRLWFQSSALHALINWTLIQRSQPRANHDTEQQDFVALQNNNRQFLWIALLDRHDKILQASDKRLLNHVLPHVPTQQSHSEILGPYRSQFALAPAARPSGQEVLLFVPAPTLDAGWIAAAIDWQWLTRFIPDLLRQRKGWPAIEMMLLDQQQNLLYALPAPAQPGSLAHKDAQPRLPSAVQPTQQVARRHQNAFTLQIALASASSLRIPHWTLLVQQQEHNALREWHLLQDKIAVSALLALILLAQFAYRLSRHLAAPLEKLQHALEDPQQAVVPEVGGYYEAWLLSRVLAELQTFEREQRLELAALNQTLERQVVERTAELANVLQHATHAFISLDHAGNVISWNRMAETLLGWPAASCEGKPLPAGLLSDDEQAWLQQQQWAQQQQKAQQRVSDQHDVLIRTASGQSIPVNLVVWTSQAGDHFRLNLILDDIRERKAAQHALQESKHRLQTITDNMPALIAYIDPQLRFEFANATLRLWYGIEPEQAIGLTMDELVAPEALSVMKPQVLAALAGETCRFERHQLLHGQYRYLHSTLIPEWDEQQRVKGVFVLTQDITARKQLELELRQQAYEDPLTGLPNRRAMHQQLPAALARADRLAHPLALLFMDLDGFKAVNDNYGHDAGDEVLRQFAARIALQIRETDSLFRLAGDEFTLLLENLTAGEADALRVAEKILVAMQAPFVLPEAAVTLSSSIGIAVYAPGGNREADALVAAADEAMYEAKHSGKNTIKIARTPPGKAI